MTLPLRKLTSLLSARQPGRAAASRAVLAAATIVGLGGNALALPAVQSKAVEVSRTPYQALLQPSCVGPTCVLDSVLVGTGRRLEIHHISCDFRTAATTDAIEVRTAVAGSDNNLKAMLGFHRATEQPNGSGSRFTVSEPVFMFVPSNRKLRIIGSAGAGSLQSFGCFISGEWVRLKPS